MQNRLDRQNRFGRLSPSMIVALVALVVAMSGTAVAAGEIITRSDQLAADVVTNPKIASDAVTARALDEPSVNSSHLTANSVGESELDDGSVEQRDQAHPILRTRVGADGSANGDTRPPTERIATGFYRVTFDRQDLPGRTGLSACAFSATPESSAANFQVPIEITVGGLSTAAPFTVLVQVKRDTFEDNETTDLVRALPVDSAFYLTAAC